PLGNPGSAFYRKPGDPNILTDPIVTKIAAAHGKFVEHRYVKPLTTTNDLQTPAQVVLRWDVQQGIIVIPKSTSETNVKRNLLERIKENAALFDFQLTEPEMKEIDGLDHGLRIVDHTDRESDHPYFPFWEEY
ncbi:unnamed protein product, partial [Angiostrongylus costaricensis]|uniref:Aldo_ket_red domain-containing protein n=1 Tax=Angiostrongylus costaricensis TaxID=334426 RepID=A0A0R3PI50_ANGCS